MSDANDQTADRKTAGEYAQATTARTRVIRSTDLLAGAREVLIEHAGSCYSLRQTSNGKLILTK